MLAPNNGLNLRVGEDAVLGGTYTTSVPQAYAGFNQVMMRLAEVFDPFIQKSLIAHPKFWYNVIARGAFPNFNGTEHETRIFRGGLQHYAGLSDWSAVNPNPTESNNPCVPGGYTTPTYAWERLQWSGFTRRWGSDPMCLNDLKYVQRAQEQLAWILQVGADYGISLQEVWNRDYLIHLASTYGRSFLMTREYVGNSAAPRFYYNPFVKFGTAAGEVNPNTGITAPFVVFPTGVEIEPLNFDVLDNLHSDFDVSCPGSALSSSGGENMFGLPVSRYDFERYIRGSDWETKNWRETRSEQLINGLGQGVKSHRGWSMSFDENQLRFQIKRYIPIYNSAQFGGVGSALDGTAVTIAQYVPPRIAGRVGENGQQIPEYNPAYNAAQIAIVPTLQKDIFTNLMGTEINTLGSGTFFGPQAGLNGKWTWTNIVSEDKNPEGTIGNFRGRFEIFPKPDPSVVFATAMMYRRCTEPIKSLCPVDNAEFNPEGDAGPVVAASYTASDAYVADLQLAISAKLASSLTGAGPGTPVELKFAGALNPAFQGYITASGAALSYQFTIVGVTGLAAAAPADGTAGYYISGGKLTYKAVDTTVTALTLSTAEAK
jgi:hypothetical protein